MSDDSILPPAPEERSDDKTAADEANDQRRNNPEPKVKPRRGKPFKWLGLTEAKWRELLAIAMLIPWVWVDILDTHSFIKLFLLAICLAVAQAVAISFFRGTLKGFFLYVWLISLIPLSDIVWKNSRPIGLEPPVLSASEIQLSDGKNFPDNEISIFNPNGVTIYWATLDIIPNVSVSPASLDIEADQPPESERSLQRGPICDFFRFNKYPSKAQPNCRGVEIQLRTLPPLSYRFVRIDGTIATNCSANLLISGYTNRLNLLGMPNVSGFTPQMQLKYSGMISNLSLSSHSNAIFNIGMDFIAQ